MMDEEIIMEPALRYDDISNYIKERHYADIVELVDRFNMPRDHIIRNMHKARLKCIDGRCFKPCYKMFRATNGTPHKRIIGFEYILD